MKPVLMQQRVRPIWENYSTINYQTAVYENSMEKSQRADYGGPAVNRICKMRRGGQCDILSVSSAFLGIVTLEQPAPGAIRVKGFAQAPSDSYNRS